MVCSFCNLKQFRSLPLGVSKSIKKTLKDMPFQSEGGCAVDFFINVQYDFEA
jgi:hypothetical protein